MSACGSCGAEITWAVTAGGKRIPLDPEPVEDGNLAVHREQPGGRLLARALSVAGSDPPAPHERRARSHFATCPTADNHRKPRKP